MGRATTIGVLVVVLAGCGSVAETEPPSEPPPDECAFDARLPDGRCLDVGVPPDACGDGFAAADGGCIPVLPPAPCPDGDIGLLGSETCAPIAPCGSGTWGEIPTDQVSLFVDGSASGGDGSMGSPYATLSEAVAAAGPGGVIALAAGAYDASSIAVGATDLTVWGRCPTMVTVRGPGRVFSVSGPGTFTLRGVEVIGGAVDVVGGTAVVEACHIHDGNAIGAAVSNVTGPASLTVRRTRIDRALDVGVLALGSEVRLEDVLVRDTRPLPNGRFGRGIDVEFFQGVPGQLTMRRSVVERSLEYNLYLSGASAVVEDTLLRTVNEGAEGSGRGLQAQPGNATAPTSLMARRVVVEDSQDAAIWTSIDTVIEDASVRDTRALDGFFGHGISVHDGPFITRPIEVRRTMVERSLTVGVISFGPAMAIERSLVRTTGPEVASGRFGRGIELQSEETSPPRLTLTDTLVTDVIDAGVVFFNADGALSGVIVRNVAPDGVDGTFGDGVVLFGSPAVTPTLSFVQGRLERAARAGIGVFGAEADVASSVFECNVFDLDGENTMTTAFRLTDGGGNQCGCQGVTRTCQIVSEGLLPPNPLP